MLSFFRRHGFVAGLMLVTALTLADATETSVRWGQWLRAHHGPDVVIAGIFFFSGLALERENLSRGILDFKACVLALGLMFGVAPLWAFTLAQWPMGTGLAVGLFLVAAMPTTLSSGVVMTSSAGGNPATALLITVVGNAAAVFATPLILKFLTGKALESAAVFDSQALTGTLAFWVLLPLAMGMVMRRPYLSWLQSVRCPSPGTVNTFLVIVIVWIGLSSSRGTIMGGLGWMPGVIALSIVFHGGLLVAAFLAAKGFGLSPGRREAVIFMGGQKTLPLSVLIQTAVFPQYGEALVFCVCHHLLHLVMDGFLLGFMTHATRRISAH